jgi:hypothetical protein
VPRHPLSLRCAFGMRCARGAVRLASGVGHLLSLWEGVREIPHDLYASNLLSVANLHSLSSIWAICLTYQAVSQTLDGPMPLPVESRATR